MSGADLTGGGQAQQDVACSKLLVNTMLSSPKAEIVKELYPGLVLDVEFNSAGTALVVLHNGQVAGGLTTPLLPRLRDCIDAGTTYKAKVMAKNAVLVKLLVFAKV
jgi:hypothetical protein